MDQQECRGPFQNKVKLVLASGSPRRRELLRGLGLEFEVVVPDVVEFDQASGMGPEELTEQNALLKAEAVAKAFPDAYVIGADTCVFVEGKILGKPKDKAEAITMLKTLSGAWHQVFTAFCIVQGRTRVLSKKIVITKVLLHAIDDAVIEAYCSTKEPYDKAGGYAVQAVGGFMVKRLEGSYTNVVGLPVSELVEELWGHHLIVPCVSV